MKSCKMQYRVVTAYGGKFSVQNRENDADLWRGGWPDYATVNEAISLIGELIAKDNFTPEEVEI